MSTSTLHCGGYGRTVAPLESHICIVVTCVDCGKTSRVNIVPPSDWYFGAGDALTQIGLGLMAPIPGWPTQGLGAQQTKRCVECFKTHHAAALASQAEKEATRRAAVERMSILELVNDMLAPDQIYKNTEYLKRIARLLKGESL